MLTILTGCARNATVKNMQVRVYATTPKPPTLAHRDNSSGRRITRLTWFLALLTTLFVGWVLWRYGLANELWKRVPGVMVEFFGLLTAAGFLTLVILWSVVLWQKRSISRGADKYAMSLDELYALSPRDFEHYVAALFERHGYQVELRGRAGDLGVDLALMRADGRPAIVQCKRYRHAIGPDIVRELFGTMVHERAVHGFLVTTAEISDAARAWAADKPITLIDGHALFNLGKRA